MRRFWQYLMKLLNWEIKGQLPDTEQFVLILAPHTSNWDMIYGLIAKNSVGGRFNFLVKNQAFFSRWVIC